MDNAVEPAAPGNTTLRYRVGGMDCPSCAGKIETALRRLGGAEGIRVNYQSQTLAFRLDEATTPRATVEGQIRSLGYDVSPIEAPSFSPISDPATAESASNAAPGRVSWWRTRKARPLLAIGTLLLLGYLVGQLVPEVGGWVELPAALLGLWLAGGRAVALARAGSPFSIEMLMSIATVGAVLIGATAEAGMVVFLFTAGEMMEGVAAGQARAGIQALAALVPRTAWLIEGEDVRQVPAATVQIGQILLVRPGDRVSVDGTIVEGASELDESPVTGELIPTAKQEPAYQPIAPLMPLKE